ncbi:MAG: hypothetical protein ABII07_02960 [Patescibacteria group bacterium]
MDKNLLTKRIKAIAERLQSETYTPLLREELMRYMDVPDTPFEGDRRLQNELIDALLERKSDPEELVEKFTQKPEERKSPVDTVEKQEEQETLTAKASSEGALTQETEIRKEGEETKYNLEYTEDRPQATKKALKSITVTVPKYKVRREQEEQEEQEESPIPETTKINIPSTPMEAKNKRQEQTPEAAEQKNMEKTQQDMLQKMTEQQQEAFQEQQKMLAQRRQEEIAARQAAAKRKKKKSLLKNPLAIAGASVGVASAAAGVPLVWTLFDIITE